MAQRKQKFLRRFFQKAAASAILPVCPSQHPISLRRHPQ
jgi:hypothetical protein